MICQHLGCRTLVAEDREFTVQMVAYALPQRRYVCSAGHSRYTDVPRHPQLLRQAVSASRPARTISHICLWCGDEFIGITRQKYCGEGCTRAVDAERTRRRMASDTTRLTPAALKQLRAIPASWNHPQRVPVGYAARPKNLSKAWV